MSTAGNLWSRQFGKPLPDLTDEMVKEAERRLGVVLPASFVDLLKVQNGGYLRRDGIPTQIDDCWPDGRGGLEVYGIDLDDDSYSVLCTSYMTSEWELPEGLVLIAGDGHWWVALDYRVRSNDPPVVYIDTDEDMSEGVLVAESFQMLLDVISSLHSKE